MHSSQKNPETLFPKRKKPRTHLATTTPRPTTTTTTKLTTNNNHQEEKKHKKIAKNYHHRSRKLPRNTKNCQKHTKKKNHFKPTLEEITSNPPRRLADLHKPPISNPKPPISKPKPLKILYHRFETHAITDQQTPSPPRLQRTLLQPIASQRGRERR